MENNNNLLNMKPKTPKEGGKTTKFAVRPSTADIAYAESMLIPAKEEKKEITQQEIENAIVYGNDATSIDFMMPEEERQILEQNLNLYSDLEKMQKTLNIAKKNKRISEDIRTLSLISDSDELITKIANVMNDKASIESLLKAFREKAEKGDSAKAYKELATTYKLILDAREELMKRVNSNGNSKNTRIALKFSNDSGEEFQLGVDI